MEDFDDVDLPPPDEDLTPCKICGRSFFPRVLKKHTAICQKSATKKRKVFDSSRQRAEGTDIPAVKPLKAKPEPPKKQSNWRRKHEEFIATIRSAKGLTQVMKDGGPLPPPPPPSYDPDYIQCPYCQRRFSENAADRHIKFCKEQASRIPNKGKLPGDTKAKPPSRPQMKALPAKKAVSPAVLPVSSSSRLPQRSSPGQLMGGIATTKTSSVGTVKGISSGVPPSGTSVGGLTSPPSGIKPRTLSSPGSLKGTSSLVGPNKRKVYNADGHNSRSDKSDCEVDNPPGQQTKFCHECGAKYPVEWAKFCCECGVRRMCI